MLQWVRIAQVERSIKAMNLWRDYPDTNRELDNKLFEGSSEILSFRVL